MFLIVTASSTWEKGIRSIELTQTQQSPAKPRIITADLQTYNQEMKDIDKLSLRLNYFI
jgi:hypothetical protein